MSGTFSSLFTSQMLSNVSLGSFPTKFEFRIFDNVVKIQVSGTFLGFNIANDLMGVSPENWTGNGVFPPLSVGFGVDISINPPDPWEKYISPFLGYRNFGIGTNVVLESANPLDTRIQGLNISIGWAEGVPVGVGIPNAFSK
jgi:hypothetical protein